MPNALITGITGQDGSYLAEFLLNKGYRVYGIVRHTSVPNNERIKHLLGRIELIDADLSDSFSLLQALRQSNAHEVYNLASMSSVEASFSQTLAAGEYTALGVTRLLEAAMYLNREIKFYQASSSEMFGKGSVTPQNENTPFRPCNPYGIAKLYAHWMTIYFRERYGFYACCGIAFNHESPRRGLTFVTRKISYGVARIHLGLQKKLVLGNIDACRDWGFAGDYVDAMWRILQQNTPGDYILASGISHSVRDFLTTAFKKIGINDWQPYVEIDPQFVRPLDIDNLVGDASKAYQELGWRPTVSFEELVNMMVESDLQLVSREKPV